MPFVSFLRLPVGCFVVYFLLVFTYSNGDRICPRSIALGISAAVEFIKRIDKLLPRQDWIYLVLTAEPIPRFVPITCAMTCSSSPVKIDCCGDTGASKGARSWRIDFPPLVSNRYSNC